MKYLMLILLTMLMGCQTVETPPLDTAPIESVVNTREEAEKIPVPSPPPSDYSGAVRSAKPVLCGPMDAILQNMMKEYNEKPFATWQDSAHGYPVMLLLNKETKTSTVLEYPGLRGDSSVFHNKACILSVGVNTEIHEPPSIKTSIHLIEK